MSIFSFLSDFFRKLEMRRKGSPIKVNLTCDVLAALRIQQAIKEAFARNAGEIADSVVAGRGKSNAATISKQEWVSEFSDPSYWEDAAESEADLFEIYSSLIQRIEFTPDGPVVYTRWGRYPE